MVIEDTINNSKKIHSDRFNYVLILQLQDYELWTQKVHKWLDGDYKKYDFVTDMY